MLKIMCVDDDLIQHQNLESMFAKAKVPLIASFYENSDAFFFALEDAKDVDAIFLDVEMDQLNGLEIAQVLRSKGYTIPIVFITGYTQYAVEGYRVQAFDYILKPISQDKIDHLLERLMDLKEQVHVKYLLFESLDGIEKENEFDILGFEAEGDYVRLILADHSYLVKSSLSQIKSRLGEQFILCHRSYLVNLNHIQSLQKETLILTNNASFPISRRLRNDVHRQVSAFYQAGDYQL